MTNDTTPEPETAAPSRTTAVKRCVRPCSACPWRSDSHADEIPGFRLELAERLAESCPDTRGMGPEFDAPVFACHESRVGEEIACAGWLATAGNAHPGIRLAVMQGRLDPEALAPAPGWPPLHPTYTAVLAQLRAQTTPEAPSHGEREPDHD